MKISCILPTFNRYSTGLNYLIEEAVECFIRQDYPDKELLIGNDCKEQKLKINHPQIKVYNWEERDPMIATKIARLISLSQGDAFCRWDDDDINLPHRLTYSANKLKDGLEWRSENYFYDPGKLEHVIGPGNTHLTAIFTRDLINKLGGYPENRIDDQEFNKALVGVGGSAKGEIIPQEEIFYLYRWNTGSSHLSGAGGSIPDLENHYKRIGEKNIISGTFTIRPKWYQNHIDRVKNYLNSRN
jgi:glycosyltransferase involved in cell wall biosynthesis